MKRFHQVILTAVLAGGCLSLSLSASETDLKAHASWRLWIDTEGRVTQMTVNDRLTDEVHAQIDPIVRRWVFIPGQIDGHSAATETSVSVNFRFVNMGDGKYAVHIDEAVTGGSVDVATESPPKYPRNEMFKGHSGLAVLDVAYGTDGIVTEVKLADGAPAVANDFVAAASKAIKNWKFSPEVVGGHALAGHAVTPMCFTVERTYGPRVPHTAPTPPMCEWKPPGARAPLHDGDVMALAPAARLRDDVSTHSM